MAAVESAKTVYSVAALLPSVHNAKRLVDGVHLRIEDLFVGAEVEVASGPPIGGPPGACRSYLTVIESGAVRLDGVSSSPRTCCLKSHLPALHHYIAWESLAGSPLLALNRIAGAKGGRCPEARGEDRALPSEDLLWPLSVPRSGMEPLREPGLAVVQQRPCRHVAALGVNGPQGSRPENAQCQLPCPSGLPPSSTPLLLIAPVPSEFRGGPLRALYVWSESIGYCLE